MPRVRVTTIRSDKARCPLCLGDLAEPIPPVRCEGCHARYHADCASDAGRCANIGCKRPLPAGRSRRRRARQAPPARLEEPRGTVQGQVEVCEGCYSGIGLRVARGSCERCDAVYHGHCAETFLTCRVGGCGGRIDAPARPEPPRVAYFPGAEHRVQPRLHPRRRTSTPSLAGAAETGCLLIGLTAVGGFFVFAAKEMAKAFLDGGIHWFPTLMVALCACGLPFATFCFWLWKELDDRG